MLNFFNSRWERVRESVEGRGGGGKGVYLGMYVCMHEGCVGSDDWSILQEGSSSKVDDIYLSQPTETTE